jgi:hypothetical protein
MHLAGHADDGRMVVYTPQFNHRYPIKSFAAGVQAHTAPDRTLQLCGPMTELALRFNLGYFVPEVVQSTGTLHYLERDGQAFCIVEAEEYQGLVALPGRYFPILERQKFGRSTLLLISDQ